MGEHFGAKRGSKSAGSFKFCPIKQSQQNRPLSEIIQKGDQGKTA